MPQTAPTFIICDRPRQARRESSRPTWTPPTLPTRKTFDDWTLPATEVEQTVRLAPLTLHVCRNTIDDRPLCNSSSVQTSADC
jgi:hypothetical protein